jgi:hypothetical protein
MDSNESLHPCLDKASATEVGETVAVVVVFPRPQDLVTQEFASDTEQKMCARLIRSFCRNFRR